MSDAIVIGVDEAGELSKTAIAVVVYRKNGDCLHLLDAYTSELPEGLQRAREVMEQQTGAKPTHIYMGESAAAKLFAQAVAEITKDFVEREVNALTAHAPYERQRSSKHKQRRYKHA